MGAKTNEPSLQPLKREAIMHTGSQMLRSDADTRCTNSLSRAKFTGISTRQKYECEEGRYHTLWRKGRQAETRPGVEHGEHISISDQDQTVGVAPPSMRNVVPVMKSLNGLAIKQTAAAMSFGCPSLLTVCWKAPRESVPWIESQAIRAGQAHVPTDSKDSRTSGTDTKWSKDRR